MRTVAARLPDQVGLTQWRGSKTCNFLFITHNMELARRCNRIVGARRLQAL
jgi:hypothetical protein